MKKTKKTAAKAESTRVVILLDRTGSMQSVKQETISGFNGYIDGLSNQPGLFVTVRQFDSQSMDTLCDGVAVKDVNRLTDASYVPRGATNLFDAVGSTIKLTRDSTKKESKVMVVILTDGEENSSQEFTAESVKALMKECEDRDKWTFAFIGMGVAGWTSMKAMAQGTQSFSNVLNVAHDAKGTAKAYRSLARASVSYCSSKGGQTVGKLFAGTPQDDTE